MRRPDPPTLVAGVAVLVLGAVLLGHSADAFELRFAAYGPLVLATVGAVLLASGLSRRD
ncbi:MAG TPA: hypothetical protein VF549_17395 [Solirubrobacteraceae bacterium]